MSSLNKVQLIGNLGADPEIRTLATGEAVATLSLATTDKWKDRNGDAQERTEWHRVSAFGPVVDVLRRYTKSGSKIYVEGQLKTRKWQDQSGTDRWTTEIVLAGRSGRLLLLGAPRGGRGERLSEPTPAAGNGFDDDIPFGACWW